MALGEIFSAAAGLGGGIGSAILSAKNQKKLLNLQEHAHEYEVKDLKKAGLNPILSAGGQGTDFGASPVDYSGIQQAGQAVASAFQLKNETQRVKNETDTTAAGVERTKAEEMNLWQDTFNKMREEGLIDAKKQREYTETMLAMGKTELVHNQLKREKETIELEIAALKEEYKTAKKQAEKDRIKSEIDRKTAWVDKVTQILGNVVSMGTSVGKTKAALTSARAAQDRATGVLMSL